MSYRLSVDVIGDKELERAFREAPGVTKREFSRAIGSTAFRIENLAKGYAPVEHGNLRGSINTKGPTATAGNVEASVGTNVEYARYQEEGTGIYGPRKTPIRPINGKLLAWNRGGKWHFARQVKGTPAVRYFRRARDESRAFFSEKMRDALTHIVSALAR